MFRNTHRSRPAALRRTHAGQPPGQPFSGSRPARRPTKCSGTPQTRAPARQAGQPLSLDPTPGLPPPHPAHQRRPARRFNPVRPFGTSPARAAPGLSTRARRAVPYLAANRVRRRRKAAPSRSETGRPSSWRPASRCPSGAHLPSIEGAPRRAGCTAPSPVLRYARRGASPSGSASPSGAAEPFDSAPCGASRPSPSTRGLDLRPRRALSPSCVPTTLTCGRLVLALLRTVSGCLPGTAVPGSPALGHPRRCGVACVFCYKYEYAS